MGLFNLSSSNCHYDNEVLKAILYKLESDGCIKYKGLDISLDYSYEYILNQMKTWDEFNNFYDKKLKIIGKEKVSSNSEIVSAFDEAMQGCTIPMQSESSNVVGLRSIGLF